VVWVSLGSGHLGSFDRRKCKGPLNGPNATGDQCPEGWTNENDALLALVDRKWVVLRVPYPLSFYAKGLDGRIAASYYTWVD
jgi:hypothetical protein